MPREVIDLWMSFRELTPNIKPCENVDSVYMRKVLEKVLEMVLVIIEEQNFLKDRQQELLRSAFPTGLDTWPVQTKNLRFYTPLMPFEPNVEKPLLLRKHSRWNIHIHDEQDNEATDKDKGNLNIFSYLPPRPTAWIILLHDLIWVWDRQMISENLVARLLHRLVTPSKSKSEWKETGWAWYHLEDSGTDKYGNDNWAHFPFPDIETFRRLDRFLSIWNHFLTKLQDKSGIHSLPRSEVARYWIFAGWIATGPDDWYNEKMLSTALEDRGEEEGTDDPGAVGLSLNAFEKAMFEKYPNFKRFVDLADK